jgi:biotin synthase
LQIFDAAVYEIVEKALAGHELTFDELRLLYSVHPYSKEAYHIRWAANHMAMRASNGKAVIYMQIGLDSSACYRNCKFCSFAACNCARKNRSELSVNNVLEYA